MTMLKKITAKSLGFNKGKVQELCITDKETQHPLYRVVGIANGTKSGEGDNGPWVGLTGMFQATNIETGEIFSSAVCFLPRYIMEIYVGGLNLEGVESVNVGVDVYAKYDEGSATSYEYIGELYTQGDASAVQALADSLPPLPSNKALAAPEKKKKAK